MNKSELIQNYPLIAEMAEGKPIVWINPDYAPVAADPSCSLCMKDIEDAEERLLRFAPFIMRCFPETAERNGLIESPLCEISEMKKTLEAENGQNLPGKLFLKMDSHLPIAGSIKARGGIYEVLKHTEELAIEAGMIPEGKIDDFDYASLADEEKKAFFGQYTVQVGSTGNLGLSIGIMSAVIGYQAVVHMSADAKQWKKDLLRSYGVKVVEYASDYSAAVKEGRKLSDQDPKSYFVDDENSVNLFLGYAVAAKRLVPQLKELGVKVDHAHPLFVYLPCGVGGAPGGVAFGLKQVFGSSVHCFFVEPTEAPCMTLGMLTGLNHEICVQDIGLSGKTEADGLAVGRASGFVGKVMKPLLSGAVTLKDEKLDKYLNQLNQSESIFIEPSACASFEGVVQYAANEDFKQYLAANGLQELAKNAVHICWATGGSLVPEEIRNQLIHPPKNIVN